MNKFGALIIHTLVTSHATSPSEECNIKRKFFFSRERPRASVKYHIREWNINKRCPIIYSKSRSLASEQNFHCTSRCTWLGNKSRNFFVCVQKWAIKYDIKAQERGEMKTLKRSNNNSIALGFNECVFWPRKKNFFIVQSAGI